MGSNMTQEEIEALMNGLNGGDNTPAPVSEEITPEDTGDAAAAGGYVPDATELGILGEIYNISMGAAATAVSSLLSMKVDITAPVVEIVSGEKLIYQPFEPAVGVEIRYIQGIEGVNVFILSQSDVMKIVDIMLGGTGIVDETAEFGELHMSAIGEVMNQMMGQSSMSLANFLNTLIDISVPQTYKIEGDYNPSNEGLKGTIIATRFKFIVGDIINSEMLTTCSMEFAKNMIDMAKKAFGLADGGQNAQAQKIIAATETVQEPAPAAVAPAPDPAAQQQTPAQPPQQAPAPAPYPPQQYYQPQPQYQPPVNMQNVQPAVFQPFPEQNYMGPDAENNPKLRNVPVDVMVEIGRTTRKVSEILEYGEGSIIELDRQSAEPVDIYVNGVLFAKGSVMVVDENFGVKITEIL